jgi:hypothetical protein
MWKTLFVSNLHEQKSTGLGEEVRSDAADWIILEQILNFKNTKIWTHICSPCTYTKQSQVSVISLINIRFTNANFFIVQQYYTILLPLPLLLILLLFPVLALVLLHISGLFMDILTVIISLKTEATVSVHVIWVLRVVINTVQCKAVLNFMRKTSKTNRTTMCTQSVRSERRFLYLLFHALGRVDITYATHVTCVTRAYSSHTVPQFTCTSVIWPAWICNNTNVIEQ